MRRAVHAILFLTSGMFILLVPMVAQGQSGHTDWAPWSFDWEVKDNAGLAIRSVFFKNELVLYKASNPVTRVKYAKDGSDCAWWDPLHIFGTCGCGPYADQITWGNLVEVAVPGGSPQKVYQTSYEVGGRKWLEIGVYARIGSYHLYQAWYLSEDGQIQPRMFSKGLQCNLNHTHHPYWRMDFDINGAALDQIFVRDNNRPNEGWGPGWHKYTNELNDLKSPTTGRVWFVRDNSTGHGAWVLPGGADGSSDGFSNKDMAARLYHGPEDQPWPFGGGHLGYDNGEGIQEKDIVYWYVSHMFHDASQGGTVWHSSGPTIVVAR